MAIPRKRSFWAVALGHMTNDIFASMGPVLLAFLSVDILSITNTQIGAAVSAQQMTGALSQPLFGWLADRTGGRWQRLIGAGGVAWMAAMLMLSLALALTGRFWLMIIPYALAALGSGAFHPVGTMLAAESDKDHAASHVSYFFLMGQSGLAIGPALAGFLLDQANPAGGPQVTVTPIFIMALFALPAVLFTAFAMQPTKRVHARQDMPHTETRSTGLSASVPIRALVILALMVALRSLAQPGLVAFIPVLFQQKGWGPTEYGLITSSFWIASGMAGVFLGHLADRHDRRHIIAFSLLLAVPALFFLPVVTAKPVAFALAIATGALTGGSHSVIVVLSQSLLPGSKGLASGATLGFIFATGALGSLIIGNLSDQIGLASAFQVVAGVVVMAGLMALFLPAGTQTTDRQETESERQTLTTPAR